MKMKKTYAKLLIFMAMAAALIGCPRLSADGRGG